MFIEIENIRYHIQIKGEGKPIICLHGFSENIGTWKSLVLEGHQLILVDLIGHGESDKPRSGKYYSLKLMLRHLNKLIHQLGSSKYSILGYSMGGRIALAYSLAYPNEIDKLVLESASYGECGLLNRLKRRRSDSKLAGGIRKNGVEWFNQYWSGLSIFETQRKLPEDIVNEISERRLSNVTYALSNTLLGTGQGKFPCLKNQVTNLSMPVLYISGEYDEKYCRTGNEFQKLNPNIRHETIRGAGHNTHIEDTKGFAEVLRKFL
jgi:2-succinyl-6-hydroxy-2,4-cyclohexadiene-1-carboxylate synthase